MADVGKGIWSEHEHERFLEAMRQFPKGPWKAIAQHVRTRSIRQVQTHAQKYQEKISRRKRGLRKQKTKLIRTEHRIDEDEENGFRSAPPPPPPRGIRDSANPQVATAPTVSVDTHMPPPTPTFAADARQLQHPNVSPMRRFPPPFMATSVAPPPRYHQPPQQHHHHQQFHPNPHAPTNFKELLTSSGTHYTHFGGDFGLAPDLHVYGHHPNPYVHQRMPSGPQVFTAPPPSAIAYAPGYTVAAPSRLPPIGGYDVPQEGAPAPLGGGNHSAVPTAASTTSTASYSQQQSNRSHCFDGGNTTEIVI